MEYYQFKENEAVLYKGGEISCEQFKGAEIDLILTNLSLVFIIKRKKLFKKEQIDVETYPVEHIKIYNGVPQIKQNGLCVEIYLKDGENVLEFPSKKEIHKFIDKAFELLTGKSTFERGVDKAKGAVATVDDSLGISTVGTVKGVVNSAIGVFGQKGKGGVIKGILNVTKDMLQPQETSSPKTASTSTKEQLETLKKLKELLDAGVITQEEFDLKKKEILGL